MTNRLQSLLHGSFAVLEQCIVSGFNVVVGYLLARGLGPEQFGLFTLLLMVIRLLVSIHQTAIFVPMLSIGPKQSSERRAFYYGAVIGHQVMLGGGLTAIVLLTACVGMFHFGSGQLLLAIGMALAYVGLASQEFVRRYFYATERSGLALQNSAISYSVQFCALGIGLLFWKLTVVDVLFIMAGGALVAILQSIRNVSPIAFQQQSFREVTARNWSMAKWLMPSIATSWIHTSAIYFVVGAMLGSTAVGELHAAFMLVAVSNIIPQVIQNYLPAGVYRAWRQHGLQAALAWTAKVAAVSLAVAILISVVATAKWSLWLKLLYGDQYTSSVWIVAAYATLVPLAIVSAIQSVFLNVMEESRVIFVSYAAMAVFTLVIAVPVVQFGGSVAAAWGAVAAQLLGIVILGRHLWRHFANEPFRSSERVPELAEPDVSLK